MKGINIKINLRQYLTQKENPKEKNIKLIRKNSSFNNIKNHNNIKSYSITARENNYIKRAKFLINNNIKNTINYNNSNPKNDFFIDINCFKKPKTTDKLSKSNKDLLINSKENINLNKNKKIMMKQIPYDSKKYYNIQNFSTYNNASFRKAMKYFTLKSEHKTIQVEDLSTYFKPIRNILRIKNIQKQKNYKNKNNGNMFIDDETHKNSFKSNNTLKYLDENNSYRKDMNISQNKYKKDIKNEKNIFFETLNNNNINISYIESCYFNKNSIQTDRTNKNSKFLFPFNIRINSSNKAIKIINNKNIKNNLDTINYNNNNSKNISDYDTQISINNNANNINKNGNLKDVNSKTLNQFRPRKFYHLSKTGINLSSLQNKNKIWINILNKTKNKNK